MAHLDESGALRIDAGTSLSTLIEQCVGAIRRLVRLVRATRQSSDGDFLIAGDIGMAAEELWENVVVLAHAAMALPAKAAAKARHRSVAGSHWLWLDRDELTARAGMDRGYARDVHAALREVIFVWPLPHGQFIPESVVRRLGYLADFLDEAHRTAQQVAGSLPEEMQRAGEPPILAGTPLGAVHPQWNKDRRELRLQDRICKRFQNKAPNQWAILDAFHEEGWPDRIDDPLPTTQGVDAKRRLNKTINALNDRLEHIRFRGDATGEGVIWERSGNAG